MLHAMVHYVIFISYVMVSYDMSYLNKMPARKLGFQKSTHFGLNAPWITYVNAEYPRIEDMDLVEDGNKPLDLVDGRALSSNLALVNGQIGDIQIAGDLFMKDISLIVLDTEGLAYRTNFSRDLVWVSRLTKNILKMNKPSPEKHQVCTIEDIAEKKVTSKRTVEDDIFSERKNKITNDKRYKGSNNTFTRHLVPSYDGYVYYVDEHHTKLLQIHVKDIVNYTPLYTHLLDGVYLQGHRKSTILALDFETGDHIMRHDTNSSPKNGDYGFDYIMTNIDEKIQQLHVGYTDWSVKAYSERKHQEIWSFNWREIGSVNTEMKNDHIVQHIRDIISVNNNNLRFNTPGLSKSESELQFPFPITSVFAVFESKRDGIHTLELISRIPLPPPTQFLVPHSINPYSPLRLSSSNNIKGTSLSINDDIIKVVDSHRPEHGAILKIMDSINHKNLVIKELDDSKQKPGIDESTTFLLKWWWLLISWVIAIVLTPLVWIYRRVRKQVHKHFDNPLDKKNTGNNTDMLSSNSSRVSSKSGFSEPDKISLDRYSDINVSLDHKPPTELRRAKSEGNFFQDEQQVPFSNSVWIEEQSLMNVFGSTKHNIPQRGGPMLTKLNHSDISNKKDGLEKEASSSALSVIPSISVLGKFLENGRFLRTFECIKLLGKGGFGAVYRAQHRLEPGNPVYAVKFVLLRLKSSEDLSSRRYFREVAANRDIYSKYVVRYYTWWCEEPHFLPLAQMTRELQIAAANNVRHLINTKAISAQKSRELDDYLQQYHDIVCQYIQNPSSDDAFPNFSKIAQSIKNRVSKIPKLFVRRRIRGRIQERSSSCTTSRNNISKSHSNGPSELLYASEGSHIQFKETIEGKDQKLSSEIDRANSNIVITNLSKEQEKQFPVVLLILMEMCNGCTLRQWLNRPSRSDKPLEFLKGHNGKTVEFQLFKQLIKGLRDIHSNCFIHRDLKPENIFVDPKTYSLKIGDLGLVGFIEENSPSVSGATTSAKAHLLSDATQVSVRGQVIGTPGYTAPEGGGNCTEKADIYSAALILLELLCPRFNTVMERLDTIENFRKSHDAPQFIKVDLKPWYELMVHMADQCPENRPSAEEVHQRLKTILKS